MNVEAPVGRREYRLRASWKALQLGGFKQSDPLTFFRHTPVGGGFDGLLGGPAVRNFKVILDYSRSRMILEPPR